MREYVPFSALLGLTFANVVAEDDKVIFTHADGRVFTLEHIQDCCEHVYIESIVGDLPDLVDSEILRANEETQYDPDTEYGEWTFYKLATCKGYVDIRFYGSSNGYYGVGVDLWVDIPE
jgi:hypothetical protein